MRWIILIIVAIVGITVLLDALRKRKVPADPSATSQRLMSANEAPPTETGKLRVREIVESLKKHPDAPKEGEAEAEAETDLPDPFDTKS